MTLFFLPIKSEKKITIGYSQITNDKYDNVMYPAKRRLHYIMNAAIRNKVLTFLRQNKHKCHVRNKINNF